MRLISGATMVAGVVGAPVRHSLSPVIQNAWIAATDLDALYLPFEISVSRFAQFVEGLRDGSVSGLNVTLPFKEVALALADRADAAAWAAGAANLLLFRSDGGIEARNTDGLGLIAAFARQAPELSLRGASIVLLGAGGAARGAVSALLEAGAGPVLILNRTKSRASVLAARFPGRAEAVDLGDSPAAFALADVLINATSVGLGDQSQPLQLPWSALPSTAVVMDMVYRPLRSAFLHAAETRGHRIVDGLSMLIGQAAPSFEALYGRAPSNSVDVRDLALRALGEPL